MLPIITLVIVSIGSTMRYTRTNMLEVLNADYIRTARAKGLSEHKVIYHHAFRNTLIPLVTFIGGSLPGLFAGALITETLFAIPGIGKLMVDAIAGEGVDYNYVLALGILYSSLYIGIMLVVDILYGALDPRIRVSAKGGANE